ASPAGIRVFATGGIGGVHRNWQTTPDVSADLHAIASSPVLVVCAGAKSILDLPATLEMLETLGVPVIGYRTSVLPRFQCKGDASLALHQRVEHARDVARVCHAHWVTLRRRSGIILVNPVPDEFAMDVGELEQAIDAAERAAISQSMTGAARTPFLLAEIARLTQGRSLHANIALLINNARLAGEVALQLHRRIPEEAAQEVSLRP